MSLGVKSQTIDLATLFGPGRHLCLPPYQRSYSWGEREAMALLGDLTESMETGMVHFIGAIVMVNEPGHAIEIVDGQQRLTTLTILLCVLRDMEKSRERSDALHELIESQNAAPDTTAWRLSLNHLDGDFFRATIQRRGMAARLDDEPHESASQRRISEVAAGFTRELEKMSAEERTHLADTIVTRCAMVICTVENRDMGYKVFRVLNDRGKAPNAHDIIKTDILERAGLTLKEADEYASRWAEYEAMIGGQAFDDLLRQIRILYDKSSKGDLIAGLRKNVIPRVSARSFLDDILPRHVKAYGEIITGRVEFGPLSDPISAYINRMRALDHHTWRAPALKFLVHHRNATNSAVEFFRRLERLSYCMQLITPKKDQRDRRYRRVAEALDNPRTVFSEASPLSITPEEAKKVRERLLGRFATFGQRRAMALRLNAALDGGQTLPPEADATVEHVLPRNPGDDSYWHTVWPDPAKRRELCDTLGNFILLPHSDNQQADRLDYRSKKKVYFNGSGGAHFALTRDLEQQEAWTADVVRQRTERLAEILLRDWDLA
ncbi:MAG: DUF262 domain-containing HNH endonuclease family protein [Hyphomonadaceae bacterium]|nr:DUF262 domain-containing HNH endonuclease family protein [Hyphomonadaceae bacterium]